MPTLPDRPLARGALPIDGVLPCWRCDESTDDDGYCSACGAVTIPREEHDGEPQHTRDHRRHGRSDRGAARDLQALTFGRLPAARYALAGDAGSREVDELA